MNNIVTHKFTSLPYLDQADGSITYAFGHALNFHLGDFDKNGFVDIISFPSNFDAPDGSFQFKPVAWMNNGETFQATDNLVPGLSSQFVRDIVEDDFNNDGVLDYVLVDTGFEFNRDAPGAASDFKHFFPQLINGLPNGLGLVQLETWNKSIDTARVFNHIGASADFDRDGDIDFAIASFGNASSPDKIYQNNGDGTFTDVGPEKFPDGQIGSSGLSFVNLGDQEGLVIGHYIGDNRTPDLYAYDGFNFVFKQHLKFLEVPGLDPKSHGVQEIKNVDINNDGREDILMMWETDNRGGLGPVSYMSTYLQDSNGFLNKVSDFKLYDSVVNIEVLDLDKDGDQDFYVRFAKSDGGTPIDKLDEVIWINDGNGNFSNPVNFFNVQGFENIVFQNKFGNYEIFDANNDGSLDIITVSQIFGGVNNSKSIGQQLSVFAGDFQISTKIGGSGADQIIGSVETDILSGSYGADTIWGNSGNDFIYGNHDLDVLYGGDGNDNLFGGQNSGFPQPSDNGLLRMIDGVETLYGGGGDDLVYGNFGSDVLFGDNGSDTLFGGQGDDTLYGGTGDDILNGNRSNDFYIGGSGADRFQFSQGNDVILDFNFSEGDRIIGARGVQISSSTDGAVISLGADNITLVGVSADSVTGDFFL